MQDKRCHPAPRIHSNFPKHTQVSLVQVEAVSDSSCGTVKNMQAGCSIQVCSDLHLIALHCMALKSLHDVSVEPVKRIAKKRPTRNAIKTVNRPPMMVKKNVTTPATPLQLEPIGSVARALPARVMPATATPEQTLGAMYHQ